MRGPAINLFFFFLDSDFNGTLLRILRLIHPSDPSGPIVPRGEIHANPE
jgi:hypothetical protein